MISSRLRKTPADPDRPILRYTPAAQNTPAPRVRIDGVQAAQTVTVVNAAGEILGTRTGSGWVTLQHVTPGHDVQSGRMEIRARTASGATSPPFQLVIDTSAQPPVITPGAAHGTAVPLRLAGEPGATVVLETQDATGGWTAIATAVLDEHGATNVHFDTALRGFRAEYFASDVFTNPVLWRVDQEINFDYQDQAPVRTLLKPDKFSVRWTGWLTLPQATTATWFLATDDGSRLFINNELVIDHWGVHGKEEKTAITPLSAGEHAVRIDYYENLGWAAAHVEWQPHSGARTYAVPVRALPAARAALAIRARQTDRLGNVSAHTTPLQLSR